MMQLREYLPLLVRSVHHQSQCDKTDVPSRVCVNCNSFTPPMLEEFCDWISRAKLEPDREVTERLDAGMTAIAGENISLPTSSVRWLWQAILARMQLLDVIDAKLMSSPTGFLFSWHDIRQFRWGGDLGDNCTPDYWELLMDFLHQVYEGASSTTNNVKHPVAPIIKAWLRTTHTSQARAAHRHNARQSRPGQWRRPTSREAVQHCGSQTDRCQWGAESAARLRE